MHKVFQQNKLPGWCTIADDDAYVNRNYMLTPYSDNSLSMVQDSSNFYLKSGLIAVEQAFGIFLSRFGIFWYRLRYNHSKDTLIVMVACKLHNFIIESVNLSNYNNLTLAAENNVNGMPLVHLQKFLRLKQDNQRCRQLGMESARNRDEIA